MDLPEINGSSQLDPRTALDGQGHGQAALLLVESLMHALLEKGVISAEEFVQTVESAAEVEQDLRPSETSSDPRPSLLYPLAAAFLQDLGR